MKLFMTFKRASFDKFIWVRFGNHGELKLNNDNLVSFIVLHII